MPKNAKSSKSSKTARVLSLLTDPAASLLGGSRDHTDDERQETEELSERTQSPSNPPALSLDDAATESRIQDSLVAELFGNGAPPRARRNGPRQPDEPSAAPRQPERAMSAPNNPSVSGNAPSQPAPAPQAPPELDMDLLSALSNPSTLGNSAVPPPEVPPPSGRDFADELTAELSGGPSAPRPASQSAPYMDMDEELRMMSQQAQEALAPKEEPTIPLEKEPEPAPAPTVRTFMPPKAPQSELRAQRQAVQPVQPTPQAVQPAPAPPKAPDPSKQEEFVCFNLTQALVEEKADKLMKQFGMCTCNRCRVDVTAIALSNLPAKYVAMQNRDILPLLSMYEERYSAAVTVQVMKACRMVMARPHHGR